MTFVGLIRHNVAAHKLRAALTAFAVAIGVMAVLALGVLTTSLESTATQILKVGNADFSVAQKHQDLLNSNIQQDDIAAMAKRARGGERSSARSSRPTSTTRPTRRHRGGPRDPARRDPSGWCCSTGHSYAANSPDQVMLGYVLWPTASTSASATR